MAGMTKAAILDELAAIRADLQALRGGLHRHAIDYLPVGSTHVSVVDDAIARIDRMTGADAEDDEADITSGSTVEPTVPPGSVGGAAADPETGWTTSTPFTKPVAAGDTSSIPSSPAFDPAAFAKAESDATSMQHAAEQAGHQTEMTGPAVQTPVEPSSATGEAASPAAEADADGKPAARGKK